MNRRLIHFVGLFFLSLAIEVCPAASDTWNKPWQSDSAGIILDPFSGNSIVWEKVKTDPKVIGIIHRASIGLNKDTAYSERRTTAKAMGYLWGSYHLGKVGDPETQADFYLSTIGSPQGEFIALDLEDVDNPSMMNLSGAVKFVKRIHDKTGRWPAIYANNNVVKKINASIGSHPELKNGLLWYARFRSTIPDFPNGVWNKYTIWQFSSEINCTTQGPCLYQVPGTKFDMDINVFDGTAEDLRSKWPLN